MSLIKEEEKNLESISILTIITSLAIFIQKYVLITSVGKI